MGQRLELQTLLETLTENVYFQPPNDMSIQYPCIVYLRYIGTTEFADNVPYNYNERYQVTVIDRDPDSLIPAKVRALPKCIKNRFFVVDNLNHDVFNLYFWGEQVTKITWDASGTRRYETGVDRGVLYIPNESGIYANGYAWQGLTKVSEKPTGATANSTYADNTKYLNLIALEEFEADISAYTYPNEFEQCDGTQEPQTGVAIGQQTRQSFGLSYRTLIGDDLQGTAKGYKIHLVYGCLAAPSQKDFASVNATPAAIEFTWSVTTTPVSVTGFKPTATLTIDSTKVASSALTTLENFLYGTSGTDPSLPLPDAVLAMFAGTLTTAVPVVPTYTSGTHTITIPTVTGLTYYIDGEVVTGSVVISQDTVVSVMPNTGYQLPATTDSDWLITYAWFVIPEKGG
jgi:hypothetical protein